MSNTVESKVVEMKFDNKDFEANVKNSMSTLDKLKEKLNFKGAADGLSNIQKASDKMDFSGMSNGIDVASVKFSALQVAGVTAITNITNSLMSLGQNIVQTFAIEPKTSGFEEYELKMGSVQTIMASTGASLEEVNGYLDELNTYSDKTIYSFSDMTENIGKFTNAGVDLKTAVKAIQGVSNEAAVSGANANEASRAMYNFAQALSAGSVKLIDWKSIENANMATVEFKNELIKTGVELGTLVEQEGKYISTTVDANGNVSDAFTATSMFNDSLSAQWMTTDVLTTTLGKYADETTELGKKAFASAQDVKTFSMMMDTLKESAGSGWAQTWELIFGDFEQAKSFWTSLTNSFDTIIQSISNARNGYLEALMGGGSSWSEIKSRIEDAGISIDDFQSKLIEIGNQQGIATEEIINNAGSLEAAFQSGQLSGQLIVDTLKSIADSAEVATEVQEDYTGKLEEFQKVVDDVWQGVYDNGEARIQALTDAGYDYAEVQDLVNKTVDGQRLTLEDLNIEQMKSIGYTQEEVDALQALAAEAEQSGSSLNSLLNDLTKMSGRDFFTKSISNTIAGLTNIFNTVKTAWADIFSQDESVSAVRSILEKIYNLSNTFLNWTTNKSDELSRSLKGVFSVIKLVGDYAGGALKFAISSLAKALSGADLHIVDMTASVGDALVAFTQWVRENEVLNAGITGIQTAIGWLIDRFIDLKSAIKNIIGKFANFDTVSDIISDVKSAMTGLNTSTDKFRQLTTKASAVVTVLKTRLKEATSGHKLLTAAVELGSKAWDELKERTSKWIEAIKGFIDEAKPLEKIFETGKATLQAFGDAFVQAGKDAETGRRTVAQACADISNSMITSVGESLGVASISDMFNKVVDTVKSIGSKFLEVFNGITKGASDTASSIGDSLSNINWGPFIAILGSAGIIYTLNTASKALNTFANSLKVFTKVPDALAGFISQGTTVLKNLDKVLSGMKFKLYADGIRSIAIAIGILAASFIALGSMDDDSMKNAIEAFGVIAGVITILMALSGLGKAELNMQLFASLAAMFAAIAAVFISLAASMKILSGIDQAGMTTALEGLAGIVVALIAVSVVISKALKTANAKQILAFAGVAVALGVATNLMALAIKSMGEMDSGAMEQGLHTVGTLGTYLAALMAISTKTNAASISAIGGMAVALGAALILVVAAIKIAGNMNEAELQQGIVVVGVLGAFLAAIIAVVSHYGKQSIQMAGTIIGMAFAIGLLVGVCKLAGNLSEDEFEKGAKAIAVFGSMCAALIIAISRLGGQGGAAKASLSLISMAIAIGALVAVCYLCSLLDDESLNRGLRAVAVLGSMVALMTYSLKGAQEANKSIIAMAITLAVLVGCVAVLGMMDPDALARGTIAMGALMLCFAAMMKAMQIVEKGNVAGTLATLVVLTAVVVALAGIIYAMSALDVQNALPNAVALSVLLLAFSVAMKTMGSMKGDIGASRTSIAVMLLVAIGLAAVLSFMSSMDIQNGIVNAVALSILLLAFAAAMRIMSGIDSVSGSAIVAMTALTVVCAGLAGVLGLMTAMNVQNAIVNAVALSIFVNALAAACKILGTISTISPMALVAMAALTAVCAGLVLVLALMNALNVQDALPNVLALSTLVLALSAACILLGVAGTFGVAGVAGVGILVTLIAAVGGLMLGIGELNKLIPDMQECVNNAIPILVAIGDGLGEMIGHFVGGALEGLSAHLPAIATNLSDFIANLDPFMSKVESIGGKDFSGIQQLASAIIALSAAELLQGMSSISDFFTGNNIQSTLKSYAEAIVGFCEEAKNIDLLGCNKGMMAAPMIKEIMEAMPNEGGLAGTIFGSKSNTISALKDNLKDFAAAIADFANGLSDVELDNVAHGVEAGKKIAELMGTDMPTTGGLAGMIFGDKNNTLTSLKDNLDPFADAIVSFATKTANITTDGVEPAINAIKAIVSALSEEGIQQGLNFYVDTESIKNRFNGLGEAIANFAARTTECSFDGIDGAVGALSKVAQFINNDLAEFNGGNVEGFVTAVNQLATTNVAALITAFQNGSSQMTEAGMNLMAALALGISSGANQASTTMTTVATSIKLAAEAIVGEFTTVGMTYIVNLASGITGNQSTATSAGSMVANATQNTMSSAAFAFTNIGRDYMSKLASGIRDNVSTVKTEAGNALNGIENHLRSYRDGFYRAGAYCMQGLAAGIRDNKSAAITEAGNAAAEALQAANSTLEVASPSKAFYRTGRWSVIGLANGIKAFSNIAANAGTSLAQTVMGSVNDSLNLMNAIPQNDLGFASLTPVLDYSGISKYGGTLDLSASLGSVITEPMRNNFDALEDTQKAITNSNNQVLASLDGLRDDMSNYNRNIAGMENAVYINGKKIASTIAKDMNKQLGTSSRREAR